MTRTMDRAKLGRITELISDYATEQGFDLLRFNGGIHLRLTDGFTTLDVWPSTGKYYVQETNYVHQGGDIVERAGERGRLPNDAVMTYDLLNKLFFAVEL